MVVIGNFDGVHRGHVGVLADARTFAARSAPALVVRALTFDPHPATVMGRVAPPVLTTLERKAELLRRSGADEVVVRTFDRAFSENTPETFARELLAGALGELGRALGFETHAAELRGDGRGPFSSTRVRAALGAGDLDEVFAVLGRPHAFSGVVVHGAHRGRTIGFPTANVDDVPEMLPPDGVYAVRVEGLGGGVMNVGVRPTVAGAEAKRTQEVHLFDVDRDLYGERLRVHVIGRIRGEQKFSGIDALRAQIAKDAESARRILA